MIYLNLNEGMRGGDLEDLILPLLSVDEYESKIDDDAIVIAFYVSEHGAAEDLNRYIQRSPIEILDSEISPAPDAQGYFMVFVELLKNRTIAENITAILEDIGPLANIENWKMQVRGQEDLLPYEEKDLTKILNPEQAELAEGILTFLKPSDLNDAAISGDTLTLSGGGDRYSFEIVAFGSIDEVLARNNLQESAVSMKLDDVTHSHRLAITLGNGWHVARVAGLNVLHFGAENLALILR